MRNLLVGVVMLMLGCGKGEQHAVELDCDSRDSGLERKDGEIDSSPHWCAGTMDSSFATTRT